VNCPCDKSPQRLVGTDGEDTAASDKSDLQGSNLARDMQFDQVAFHDPKGRLQASKGGVFDFQQ
jgi:hypothetical protein